MGRNKYGLSQKEEKFVNNVLSARFQTQLDAYWDSYGKGNIGDVEKRRQVSRAASKVMAKPHVKQRFEYLRSMVDDALAEKAVVTIETITAELDENRVFAKTIEQAAAMNSATIAKAKLHGLMKDKVDHTSSDGSMSPSQMTDAVMDALRRKHEPDT